MTIEPIEIVLKNGLPVTLKSPSPTDAKALLDHLRINFREAHLNFNQPASYWEKVSVAEEEKSLADFARAKDKFLLSAFSQDQVIGNLGLFGSTGEYIRHCATIGMGIRSAFFGMGLGTALLRHAILKAKEYGFHSLELRVRTYNAPAIALYEKVGFERMALLKDAALIHGVYRDEYLYQKLI